VPSHPRGDPHAARAAPARRRLLTLLEEDAQDAHQLAAAMGLHVTTVRFHLQILERAGLAESRPDPRGRAGRPRTLHAATSDADPHRDLRRKVAAYEELEATLAAHLGDSLEHRAERAEQAGASWSGRLAPHQQQATDATDATARVHELCHHLGFDPETVSDRDGWQIFLRACPFRAVARTHPEVVCGVHRGLIRGTLAEAGVPGLMAELAPFVEPELCIARVGSAVQGT
jgi:predicted ArsR family transcriptional regulator